MFLFHLNLTLAASLVLGSLGAVSAAPDDNQEKGQKKAKQQQQASPFAEQITELRAARALLEKADHDYKGHRAKAVKEITAAIHDLQPPPPATGKGKANHAKGQQNKTGGGNNEPQAVSDAQLKQAMEQLAKVATQLASAQGDGPTKATGAIKIAIAELETALKIK